MVRLFSCLILFANGAEADEEKENIPKHWVEEAKEYKKGYSSRRPITPDYERELVKRIREHILATQQGEHSDYQSEIPETGVEYEMIAIPGGTFLIGSPEDEKDRNLDEGPQREIEVSDFWMGKFEVTWDQFMPYAVRTSSEIYTILGTPRNPENAAELVHWVSAPSQPYTEPAMGMSMEDKYPVVNMSYHAVMKFCQWLSLQTGHFYRLPTEAEWEYACRAGTTGPFSCPTEKLSDYAVLDPTQTREAYEKVGTKKPNPWGLYDMHGNVMEWCLDAYLPGYAHFDGKDPMSIPTQRFGRVIRGGSWYDTSEYLRSAARWCSTNDLLMQDPQLPKSIWWLTDAYWLGFRLARTNEIPSEDQMYQIWNSGAMHEKEGDKVFKLSP